MHHRDPLLRMALRIARALHIPANDHPLELETEALIAESSLLRSTWRRICRCRQRHWHLAADRLQRSLQNQARNIEHWCRPLLQPRQSSVSPPDPMEIRRELLAIEEEFGAVEIDLKLRTIRAVTDPVALEEIELGPFAIELHASRLGHGRGSDCFRILALEPNPAASNESVTHPHVSDGVLCPGEASAPIREALNSGRLLDAFCLVRSVLSTYNAASPYVRLEDWTGVACADCGYSTDHDNLSFCPACEKDYCEECISICEICEESCCSGCLERDRQSGRYCCPSCRHTCAECERTVDHDSFDEESELCPECRQQQEENEDDHDTTDPTQTAEVPTEPAQGATP
jgi:hypothetical protein